MKFRHVLLVQGCNFHVDIDIETLDEYGVRYLAFYLYMIMFVALLAKIAAVAVAMRRATYKAGRKMVAKGVRCGPARGEHACHSCS